MDDVWASAILYRRTPAGDVEFLVLRSALSLGDDASDSSARIWVTPGGRRDSGESHRECAQREAFEETGVRIEDLQLLDEDAPVFAAEVPYETRVRLSIEHDEYRWLSAEAASAVCHPLVAVHVDRAAAVLSAPDLSVDESKRP
jgi:8-oxo-dGTP pyrophosphatase MutT (NUDIX family)